MERRHLCSQSLCESRESTYTAQIWKGMRAGKVIVETCFRLSCFATVWVIKLACPASARNTFLLPPLPNSWNKNYFQKFNTHPFKKIRTMGSFSLLCNGLLVHIFMLLFWGGFKKQYFIQNGGDHSVKFREQLDFVKLAFIPLLCHFSTQLFSETLNEIVWGT